MRFLALQAMTEDDLLDALSEDFGSSSKASPLVSAEPSASLAVGRELIT